jgi:hypothetical protein
MYLRFRLNHFSTHPRDFRIHFLFKRDCRRAPFFRFGSCDFKIGFSLVGLQYNSFTYIIEMPVNASMINSLIMFSPGAKYHFILIIPIL